MMISAEVTMGTEYSTVVHGDTIEDVLEKIKDYHKLTDFEINHYSKKGTLDEQIATGWYIYDRT